jgi:hypothetical protein
MQSDVVIWRQALEILPGQKHTWQLDPVGGLTLSAAGHPNTRLGIFISRQQISMPNFAIFSFNFELRNFIGLKGRHGGLCISTPKFNFHASRVPARSIPCLELESVAEEQEEKTKFQVAKNLRFKVHGGENNVRSYGFVVWAALAQNEWFCAQSRGVQRCTCLARKLSASEPNNRVLFVHYSLRVTSLFSRLLIPQNSFSFSSLLKLPFKFAQLRDIAQHRDTARKIFCASFWWK